MTNSEIIRINSNSTLDLSNRIVEVDSTSGAVLITLPLYVNQGYNLQVIDVSGTSSINNITIQTQGNSVINLAASVIIDTDYSEATIVYDKYTTQHEFSAVVHTSGGGIVTTVTADNGLNFTGGNPNNITLGGILLQTTDINQDDQWNFSFSNTRNFSILTNGAANGLIVNSPIGFTTLLGNELNIQPQASAANPDGAFLGKLNGNGKCEWVDYTIPAGTSEGTHLYWNSASRIWQEDLQFERVEGAVATPMEAVSINILSSQSLYGINTTNQLGARGTGQVGNQFALTNTIDNYTTLINMQQPNSDTTGEIEFLVNEANGVDLDQSSKIYTSKTILETSEYTVSAVVQQSAVRSVNKGLIQETVYDIGYAQSSLTIVPDSIFTNVEDLSSLDNTTFTQSSLNFHIEGGQLVRYSAVLVANTLLDQSYYVVLVDTTLARTITLPASPSNGTVFIIKDYSGNAAVANITINGNGILIDGAGTKLINTAYGKFTLLYNSSTSWSII